MNNSTIKAKIIEVIRWWPTVPAFVVLCLLVWQASKRDLTSLESVQFQVFSLIIGCGVSIWVGKEKNRKESEDTLKSKAREATRYLVSLSKSILRARFIASAGLSHELESSEDFHVIRGALIATSTEQFDRANEALENWRDILGDEFEVLIKKLLEEKITTEELEDYIRELTYNNVMENE